MKLKGESLTISQAHRDGSDVTKATHLGPGRVGLTVVLAPDGEQMAFSTTRGLRRRQIAHVDGACFLQPIN